VLQFLAQARQWWTAYQWIATELNGGRGVILYKDGVPNTSISFAYDEAGALTNIYITRNPDKLSRLSVPGP